MKYLFTILVSILILIAVLLPGSAIPDVNVIGFDKIVHIGLFGLWATALRYDFQNASFKFFFAFIVGLGFSLLTEVLQVFIEGRTFDWFDVLADAVGLILGLSFGLKVLALLKMK